MILSGRQLREGRLLIGMGQTDVAEAAGINPALMVRAEAVDGMPMLIKRDAAALRSALEAAGSSSSRRTARGRGAAAKGVRRHDKLTP